MGIKTKHIHVFLLKGEGLLIFKNFTNMSMLSEPRRRQKWTLNPRGTLWTKDENKIGQKLLEKFGWKSGEGLGKTSQGMKDPIALNANFNQKGLGHEGKDDDVWLAHKDNFDDVLASLNSAHNSQPNSDEEKQDEAKEKQSLASTSKKSRKRVHYEKFTRGKDLSTYSQTDLSCILGTEKRKKRKLDNEEAKVKEDKEDKSDKTETDPKDPTKDTSGLVVIEGGSIDDYFKMKMKKLEEKRKQNAMAQNGDTEKIVEESKSQDIVDEDQESSAKKSKKSKKNKKDKSPEIHADNSDKSDTIENGDEGEEKLSKKERKRRKKEAKALLEQSEANETKAIDKVVETNEINASENNAEDEEKL